MGPHFTNNIKPILPFVMLYNINVAINIYKLEQICFIKEHTGERGMPRNENATGELFLSFITVTD